MLIVMSATACKCSKDRQRRQTDAELHRWGEETTGDGVLRAGTATVLAQDQHALVLSVTPDHVRELDGTSQGRVHSVHTPKPIHGDIRNTAVDVIPKLDSLVAGLGIC
jgi:hypothetical protein